MKYRGVKIERVEYNAGVDIGKRESSPVKSIIKKGWSPIGVGYPMGKQECFDCIDRLIINVIEKCNVTEKEAIKLINNN